LRPERILLLLIDEHDEDRALVVEDIHHIDTKNMERRSLNREARVVQIGGCKGQPCAR
jgi:hypothetical protein